MQDDVRIESVIYIKKTRNHKTQNKNKNKNKKQDTVHALY